MKRLRLSFAELYCLLRAADDAPAARAVARLRLPEVHDADEMVAAGLSSLVARELATVSPYDVRFDPVLVAITATMTQDEADWLRIVTIAPPAEDAAQVVTGELRFVVTHVGPGLYEFAPLDMGASLGDAVAAFFDAWAQATASGVFGVSWADHEGVSAIVKGDAWRVIAADAEPGVAVNEAAASDAVRAYVEKRRAS